MYGKRKDWNKDLNGWVGDIFWNMISYGEKTGFKKKKSKRFYIENNRNKIN